MAKSEIKLDQFGEPRIFIKKKDVRDLVDFYSEAYEAENKSMIMNLVLKSYNIV